MLLAENSYAHTGSNFVTSFDMMFTIWPGVVLFSATVLSFSAYKTRRQANKHPTKQQNIHALYLSEHISVRSIRFTGTTVDPSVCISKNKSNYAAGGMLMLRDSERPTRF